MPFAAPTFNLLVSIWRAAAQPFPYVTGRPGAILTTGNLRVLKTAFLVNAPVYGLAVVALAIPAHVDVRGGYGWNSPVNPDVIECPRGSGRFYEVAAVEDVGKGFANEYRLVVLVQKQAPTPLP